MTDQLQPECPYVTGQTTRYCTLTPFTLTDAEREAIRFALKSLDWPLDGPQLAVVARTVGASCEVPEHRMKARLRGLLERTQ
jgi:hypothetical protein